MVTDYRSRLGISDEALEAFCKKWKIAQLELFGSALRDDFTAASDIDLLYVTESDAGWSLFDHIEAEVELADLTGRKVDLVSRKAIEQSENYLRRRRILSSALPVYTRRRPQRAMTTSSWMR